MLDKDIVYVQSKAAIEAAHREAELHNQLDELQKALLDGDFSSIEPQCSKIIANLSERNRLCALNK